MANPGVGAVNRVRVAVMWMEIGCWIPERRFVGWVVVVGVFSRRGRARRLGRGRRRRGSGDGESCVRMGAVGGALIAGFPE